MSDEPLRFERGDLSLSLEDDGEVSLARPHPEVWVGLDADELRWLVLTAGPAMVAAMAAPLPGTATAEADAGDGGGPSPAAADGTGPPDGQLGLDEIAESAGDSPLG